MQIELCNLAVSQDLTLAFKLSFNGRFLSLKAKLIDSLANKVMHQNVQLSCKAFAKLICASTHFHKVTVFKGTSGNLNYPCDLSQKIGLAWRSLQSRLHQLCCLKKIVVNLMSL